jgi:hypothetical protein
MKRNNWLLLLLFFGWACGSGSKDPVDVVKAYVNAIDGKDFTKARQYVTEKFRPDLEYIEKQVDSHVFKMVSEQAFDKRFELLEKTDSTAKVFRGAKIKDSEVEVAQNFYLVKEKGKWLIDKTSINE